MKPTTVREFFKTFPSDEACLAHLFDVRFGQGHPCPACNRAAKWYPLANEKAFSCQWCGHHIHPMSGTIFQDSRTSLQTWFYVVFLFTTTRHGVSGKEIQRQTGVTYKTAYRMGQQIRKHMAAIDGDQKLGGEGQIVEVDEAYVGGYRAGDTSLKSKTIVLGMVERGEGGEAIIKVIPDARRDTIQDVIQDSVEPGTEVHADMHQAYDNLDQKGYGLKRINKVQQGYVGPRGETVNAVENFWRHLKSSIQGTHISVSKKHLQTYAKEFEYRFNRRMTPSKMLSELLSRFPELDA
jgi:transposase-like protein